MRLSSTLALVVAGHLVSGYCWASPLRDIVDEVQRRAVQIEALDDSGNPAGECATGIVIGPRTILTANHVADHVGTLRVTGRDAVFASVDVSPTQRTRVSSANAAFDVALLIMDKLPRDPFESLGAPFDALGWMDDDDFIDYPEAFVLSFHAGRCKPVKDNAPQMGIPVPVSMSHPGPFGGSIDGKQSYRIKLGTDLGEGYSGAALVSRRLGAVIGVYTAGASGNGYATSLLHVRDLFDARSPEPRTVERLRPLPGSVDLAATLAHEIPRDDQLQSTGLSLALTTRYLFWQVASTRVASSPTRVWLTAVLAAGFSTWHRTQILSDYPGVGSVPIAELSDQIVWAAPSLGVRADLGRLLVAIDGLAGVRASRIFSQGEARAVPYAQNKNDAQTIYSFSPELTVGFRLFPGRVEQPAGFSIIPVISGSWTLSTRAIAQDYQFNFLGDPTPVERTLRLPRFGARVGLQVTL